MRYIMLQINSKYMENIIKSSIEKNRNFIHIHCVFYKLRRQTLFLSEHF